MLEVEEEVEVAEGEGVEVAPEATLQGMTIRFSQMVGDLIVL